MAIALRNYASNTSTGTTTFTINKPTDTADNDVMVASIQIESATATVTAPGGWTAITNAIVTTSYTIRQYYFWKLASSEGASYDFTISSGSIEVIGTICSFSGCSTTVPLGRWTVSSSTASTTAHAAATLTTQNDGATILFTAGTPYGTTYTGPASWNEICDLNTGTDAANMAFTQSYLTYANKNTATGTITATSAAADRYKAVMIELTPAGMSSSSSKSSSSSSRSSFSSSSSSQTHETALLGTIYNKPPVYAKINFSHPLAVELAHAYIFNEGRGTKVRDYVRGNDVTLGAGITWVKEGIEGNGGATDTTALSYTYYPTKTQYYSVVARFRWDTYADQIVCGGATGGTYAFMMNDMNTCYTRQGVDQEIQTVAGKFNPNQFRTMAFTHNCSAGKWWMDGENYFNTATFTCSDSYVWRIDALAGTPSGNYTINGVLEFVYVFDRVLSPEEVKWITAFPYDMFEWDEKNWQFSITGSSSSSSSKSSSSSSSKSSSSSSKSSSSRSSSSSYRSSSSSKSSSSRSSSSSTGFVFDPTHEILYGKNDGTQSEEEISWSGWKTYNGDAITLSGGEWGNVLIDPDGIVSPVHHSGNGSNNLTYYVNYDRYSNTLVPTIYYRHQNTSFNQNDINPEWILYTEPFITNNSYTQIMLTREIL